MRPSSQHGSHESYCYTTLLSVGACFKGCYFVSFILAGGDTAKMGHFVVSAAVNVRVGKSIKQPTGRGEYRSDIRSI